MPSGLKPPDALRRTLLIELPGTDKTATSVIEAKYDRLKPKMMGALLSVLSGVLAHLGEAQSRELPDCPEMADFARLLLAADLAFPGLGDPAQPGLGGLYAAYAQHVFEVMVKAGLEDQLTLLVMRPGDPGCHQE